MRLRRTRVPAHRNTPTSERTQAHTSTNTHKHAPHARTHAHTSTPHTHTHTHTRTDTHMHTHAQIHTHTHTESHTLHTFPSEMFTNRTRSLSRVFLQVQIECGPVHRMRQDPGNTHLVATGGRENDLRIWDLNAPQEAIFKAKNVSKGTRTHAHTSTHTHTLSLSLSLSLSLTCTLLYTCTHTHTHTHTHTELHQPHAPSSVESTRATHTLAHTFCWCSLCPCKCLCARVNHSAHA